jgi:hypothetical protein
MTILFYDSVPAKWPLHAEYAALYLDGDWPQLQYNGRFPNTRWITVDGHPDAGIADYELDNPVYDDPGTLLAWAQARHRNGYRARVYCDRADYGRALAELGHTPVIWWIATLDGNPGWTPALIAASIHAEYDEIIDPATVWGIQWKGGPKFDYDTSTLFGEW